MSIKASSSPRKPGKNYLNFRLSTWHKNSHQLYDYSEASSAKTDHQYELPVNKTSQLFILRSDKTNQAILEIKEQQVAKHLGKAHQFYLIAKIMIQPNLESRKLQLCFQKNVYTSDQPTNQHLSQTHFPRLVVSKERDSKHNPKGCLLKAGNIISFGRVKYLVREIKLNGCVSKFKELEKQNKIELKVNENGLKQEKEEMGQICVETEGSTTKVEVEERIQCRICFDVGSPSNQLISVCKCTGSCKYTHFQCLKSWVDMRVVVNVREYCIKIEKMDCQICKAEIPMSVNSSLNSQSELLLISRPQGCDYVMLEKLEGREKNMLIIKSPPFEGVSVGRDASSYIKINDISVSRVHAFIKYKQGQFCVYDNDSKFGTLVMQQEPKIEVGKIERSMQIGRTVMDVVVKPKDHFLQGI